MISISTHTVAFDPARALARALCRVNGIKCVDIVDCDQCRARPFHQGVVCHRPETRWDRARIQSQAHRDGHRVQRRPRICSALSRNGKCISNSTRVSLGTAVNLQWGVGFIQGPDSALFTAQKSQRPRGKKGCCYRIVHFR